MGLVGEREQAEREPQQPPPAQPSTLYLRDRLSTLSLGGSLSSWSLATTAI